MHGRCIQAGGLFDNNILREDIKCNDNWHPKLLSDLDLLLKVAMAPICN